jgi:murein L,D-transpeptidase YafK
MNRVLRIQAQAALQKPTVMVTLFAMSLSVALYLAPLALAEGSASSAPGGKQQPDSGASSAAAETVSIPSDTVPSSILQIPVSSNFYSPYAFVVDKKARTLNVWQQTETGLKQVAQFPADMGKNSGEKRSRGDAKTPEGIYFLLERREGASLDFNLYGKRAFTTDYPNFFDRIDGKTGDGIWLHAVPDHVALTRGSKGCVVVRNNVILDISQYVKLGKTPILIQDHIDLLPAKEANQATVEVSQWLESWRAAWEAKNTDQYIEHYANEFRSMNMNKKQWRAYKDRLNKQYKSIAVHLSRPEIFADRDRAVVRFLQEYTSALHSDIGEKTLFLKKTAAGYRIMGEIWSEESSQLARQEIEAAQKTTTLTCGDASGNHSCMRTSASTHQ